MLIDHGADVTALTDNKSTALHLFSRRLTRATSNEELLDSVISKITRRGVSVNAVDGGRFHRTPLHYAVMEGWVRLICLLLENGADPSMPDSEGHDAFWYAERGGDERIAKILENYKRTHTAVSLDAVKFRH